MNNPLDAAALKDAQRAMELDDARDARRPATPVGQPLDLHLLALEQISERLLQIQQSIRALAVALHVGEHLPDR